MGRAHAAGLEGAVDERMTGVSSVSASEGPRFGFGENWQRFLLKIDAAGIAAAERSLQSMLGVADLAGKRFLDIGSGSGLFSLAARRLGATVVSFDYDAQSVACAMALRQRYVPNDAKWSIERGSALDEVYLRSHGTFDIVYSWGVLHHTGAMWQALALAALPVTDGGTLFVALYNDQGWISRYWLAVKRIYNSGTLGRLMMIAWHAPYLIGLRALLRVIRHRGRIERGMTLWYDMLDWLGGLPFEVAAPEAVIEFYGSQGFAAQTVKRVGRRHGCNEFILRRR